MAVDASPLLRTVIEAISACRSDDAVLSADTELLTSGILDSFAVLEFVDEIESRLEVRIPSDYLVPETFSTPSAVVTVLQAIS